MTDLNRQILDAKPSRLLIFGTSLAATALAMTIALAAWTRQRISRVEIDLTAPTARTPLVLQNGKPTPIDNADMLSVPGGVGVGEAPVPGYLKATQAFFGIGAGADTDLSVIGCTNLEQLRMLSPYRPPVCIGCSPANSPWDVQVDNWGAPGDFAAIVRTSNLHITPTANITWTGSSDGNDTGRLMFMTNDSDTKSITFTSDDTSSLVGNRYTFPGALPVRLRPHQTYLYMHDDNVGRNSWDMVGPDASSGAATIGLTSCGSGATVTATWQNVNGELTIAGRVVMGDAASSCTVGYTSPTFIATPACAVYDEAFSLNYWNAMATPTASGFAYGNASVQALVAFNFICMGPGP